MSSSFPETGYHYAFFNMYKTIWLEVSLCWDVFLALDVCSFEMPNKSDEFEDFFCIETRLSTSKQPVC